MTEVHVRGAHATVRAEGLEDEVAVEEPLEILTLAGFARGGRVNVYTGTERVM